MSIPNIATEKKKLEWPLQGVRGVNEDAVLLFHLLERKHPNIELIFLPLYWPLYLIRGGPFPKGVLSLVAVGSKQEKQKNSMKRIGSRSTSPFIKTFKFVRTVHKCHTDQESSEHILPSQLSAALRATRIIIPNTAFRIAHRFHRFLHRLVIHRSDTLLRI